MFGGHDAGGTNGGSSPGQNQGYFNGPNISLLNNAQHTNIVDSQINIHAPGHTGIYILGEKSAMGATYNSLERQRLDAPKCHPNTRVAVINRLISWIRGEMDFDALILWLYGAAGAGKSAIAHTLAERCENYGYLLATFFFWKTAAERNDVSRFVATIAYQVARAIPNSRRLIETAVNADPMIFKQSVDIQLVKLIIEPIWRLHSTGFDFKDSPFVIIIDGLDECEGKDIQSGLVKSLAAAFHHSPLRIRILIASRPEVYLQSTFNLSSLQPHLSRVALSNEYSAEKDIRRFLEDSFDKIKREHPLASYIPSSWPSADVLRELTQKSSGQFIFASTTVKYAGGDPHELPTRRLDVIRRLQPHRGEGDLPYTELNSLYHHVLSNVRDVERVKDVLGILIIVNPLPNTNFYPIDTAQEMDELFFWQPGETKACLGPLESVIGCDGIGRISIFHASLSDFLLDPSRSREFYLCREVILSDCAAQGLRHLHQQGYDENNFSHYNWFTFNCISAGPFCTPRLREELSQLSLQALYGAFEIYGYTWEFWQLTSTIIEMLHNRNLLEQFPHFITDLPTVFFEGFHKADSDETPTLLVYEEYCSHIPQFTTLNPAPAFNLPHQIRGIVKRIVTLHPQRYSLKFTGQHYAVVACHSMYDLLWQDYKPSRLFSSADVFHRATDSGKKKHSDAVFALLCIAHALPLACESENIMEYIFSGNISGEKPIRNFHGTWTLDGWNDGIIQPARDAVLNYYKRYAEPSEVREYMRLNSLS